MPSKRKRIRRRQKKMRVLPVLISIFAAFAALLTVLLVLSDPLNPNKDEVNRYLYPENPEFVEQHGVSSAPLVVQHVTPRVQVATPQPTLPAQQMQAQTQQGRVPAAAPFDYFLPVHNRANLSLDDPMMIAITIDGCDDKDVLEDMIKTAKRYGAKLTLFPTGEALMDPKLTSGFRNCVKSLGYELENCGFIVSNEYKMTDAELALNVWKHGMAASYAIGVDYEQHFYRPANINNANDQRTHFFARKLGYHGIATYTHSYVGHNLDSIADTLKSGNIYRFDMSEPSLELFKLFVRAASEKGYQLVTLNQLFGYEENKLSSELTIDRQTLPSMDDYIPSYYDLELGNRARAVIDLQKRLMELGYLDVNQIPDGVYGSQTSIAVSRFQASVSLPAIGDANVATLEKLYGGESP